jgi:hypothetical protein
MTMRVFNFKKYVAASIALLLIGSATNAAACTNATLKGAYGFGSTVVQDSFGVPSLGIPGNFLELAGLFQFDGKGNATTSFTYARNDGAVGIASALLVYTVAADCTFTLSQDNGESFSGVIVLDGQQFFFVETTGGDVNSTAIVRRGQAVKVHTGS